jgi:hypothetical protein
VGDKDILKELLKALQQRSDDEEDKDLKTLFREVRDELRIMNGNTKEDRASREQAKTDEELAKMFPALRQRGYGNRVSFAAGRVTGLPPGESGEPGYGR